MEESDKKGINGFTNLGNTCYINSCIQVLFRLDSLNHFFDNDMKIYKALRLRGIPTTILVNKKGLVISKHEGILKWGEAKVVNNIINLLN